MGNKVCYVINVYSNLHVCKEISMLKWKTDSEYDKFLCIETCIEVSQDNKGSFHACKIIKSKALPPEDRFFQYLR